MLAAGSSSVRPQETQASAVPRGRGVPLPQTPQKRNKQEAKLRTVGPMYPSVAASAKRDVVVVAWPVMHDDLRWIQFAADLALVAIALQDAFAAAVELFQI